MSETTQKQVLVRALGQSIEYAREHAHQALGADDLSDDEIDRLCEMVLGLARMRRRITALLAGDASPIPADRAAHIGPMAPLGELVRQFAAWLEDQDYTLRDYDGEVVSPSEIAYRFLGQ